MEANLTKAKKQKGLLATKHASFLVAYIYTAMNKIHQSSIKRQSKKSSLLKYAGNYWDNWKTSKIDYILDI